MNTSAPANPPPSQNGEAAETGSLASTLGVVYVLIADLTAAAVFGGCAAIAVETTGWHDIPGSGNWPGLLFAMLAVGLLPLLWLGHGMLRPHITTGKLGWRSWAPKFEYCSTHPSYALIDCLTIPLFLSMYADIPSAESPVSMAERATTLRGDAMVIVACEVLVFIAFVRLVCWYVFKRRLRPEDSRRAWVPVAILVGLATALVGLIKVAEWCRSRN